jgi:protein-S-isoprenylcysteine O-methyltransferase Ste14
MYHKILADGIFVFSCFAIFMAMIGWIIGDIWLASTQWMLIAIILLLIAIYVKLSAREDEIILKEYQRKSKK